MRSLSSIVLSSLCLSLGLSLVACGSGSAAGVAADGKKAVETRACAGCHGADLGGSISPRPDAMMVFASNITPDMNTGIGGWTDDQIKGALQKGTDDEAAQLCSQMPIFKDMEDAEAANIVAYLRTVPAVKKMVPESTCNK